MAIIRVPPGRSINVEDILVSVTCPECEGSVRMKMKGAATRKNCPLCNRVTYMFVITPMRGFINIHAAYLGSDYTPRDLLLSPNDIEIDYDL